MIRNLKALGLALLATFALSAVAASGASANFKVFDSSVTPTGLTGTSEGDQIFKRGLISINCHHAAFKGTQVGLSVDTLELEAEYTTPDCTGPLSSIIHLDFVSGKCGFHLTGTASKTAVLKLFCKNAAMPELTTTGTNPDGSSLCSIHIPAQTVGGHVILSNIKNAQENNITSITAEATLTNITSVRTGNAACGPVNDANGAYAGNVTFTGYEDINGVHGKQIPIEVT